MWTLESLFAHFDAILTERELRYKERHEALEKQINTSIHAIKDSTAIAAEVLREWRAGANEWRKAMDDREENFARVEDVGNINSRIAELKERADKNEGNSGGMHSSWLIAVTIISLCISGISVFTLVTKFN